MLAGYAFFNEDGTEFMSVTQENFNARTYKYYSQDEIDALIEGLEPGEGITTRYLNNGKPARIRTYRSEQTEPYEQPRKKTKRGRRRSNRISVKTE